MKRINFLKPVFFLFAVLSFMIGCNQEEDPIVPSDDMPVKYVLPQGNERYDSVILDFYNKNEIFILYEYAPHDPTWNITEVEGFGTYRIVPPKKECLDVAIDCVFDLWLNLYPSEFFQGRLPHYIYLADTIWTYSLQGSLTTEISLTFGNINETLRVPSVQETFKNNVNSAFWTYLIESGKFEVPSALNLDYSSVSYATAKELGIIHSSTYNLNLQTDFQKTLEYLFTNPQTTIDRQYRYYPACKTRVGLFVSEMKRLYDIDLELLTGKKLLE